MLSDPMRAMEHLVQEAPATPTTEYWDQQQGEREKTGFYQHHYPLMTSEYFIGLLQFIDIYLFLDMSIITRFTC